MLPRILEPELMDSEQEALEYDSMDHSEVNRSFVADFLAVHHDGWRVLDVGTGTALIPIELCHREPRALVLAVDAAEAMLLRGANNVAAAGLVGRIHLQQADAKELHFDNASFPAVISNSIVHHIAHPKRVVREMYRVVAAGGTLFLRDLLRPESTEQLDQLVGEHAAEATEMQRELFRNSLHASLTLEELRQLGLDLGLGTDQLSQTTDRHWTWVVQKPRG